MLIPALPPLSSHLDLVFEGQLANHTTGICIIREGEVEVHTSSLSKDT